MELKEEITSLIYAAEHCTGLHELQKAQKMFASKYGSEFLHAAKDLRSGCVVNEQVCCISFKYDEFGSLLLKQVLNIKCIAF